MAQFVQHLLEGRAFGFQPAGQRLAAEPSLRAIPSMLASPVCSIGINALSTRPRAVFESSSS